MSTDTTIGANPVGEIYIGEQDELSVTFPFIAAWNPAGTKRQNQADTTLVGTDFDQT